MKKITELQKSRVCKGQGTPSTRGGNRLTCRGIKSTIWDAIENQILPVEIKLEEKEMFFHFLKENPSKLLLVLDGLDEADPQKLEMYLNLFKRSIFLAVTLFSLLEQAMQSCKLHSKYY